MNDGKLFQHKDTRVPSEPRYELRKRTHSQKQQKSIDGELFQNMNTRVPNELIPLLIHEFEKISIH